ncbi:MAG: GTP-binding protein [Promethearchaeota archaeon]|nr:MAG: GTP-binding protein [Candidatus Lokiarchaeota archaeon]
MNNSQTFKFKIVVIGDGGVGKTSLIKKFTHGTFEKDYIKTIGAQFTKLEKEINKDKISLVFWDIAGQSTFDFLNPLFYRESRACIIVYSLEENELGSESFKHIENWYDEMKMRCGNIPVVIFANKIDLIEESHLDTSKIQIITNKLKVLNYYITSAKTGQGVNDAFNIIIEKLYHKSKTLTSKI